MKIRRVQAPSEMYNSEPMPKSFLSRIDRTNLFAGLGVWLISLCVYIKTLSPTVSFWDCGEFIAVSAILGIPHPPGAPLYVIFGRIFSIIPFFQDISVRVNLLSAVSSAFTALFCYMIGVRILRFWFNDTSKPLVKFLIYAGAISGALLAAFGVTNWNNSVEAEVYGLSMALFTLMFWLTLLYLEKRDGSHGQKIMLLVLYLAFLGISVHMNSFLVVPIVALAFIMKKETPQHVWYLLAAFVGFELYLIFALSSRPDEVPYYVPILIVFVIYLFFVFSFETINRLYMVTAAGFVLAMAPLYAAIFEIMMLSAGRTATIASGTLSLLNTVGVMSFILLVLFAFVCLFKYLAGRKRNQANSIYIHIAAFVFTAALMTVVLTAGQMRGYNLFLILSVLLSVVLALLIYKYIDWAILIAIAGVITIVLGVWQFIYGALIALVMLLALGLMFRLKNWKTAVMIILVSVMGFSSHIFIPIRSSQQPAINENNPSSSLAATINFIERKQYGSESMVERMFKRRAEWSSQFGNFQRMGFWEFFNKQYGLTESAFVFPFLIGIFGIWEIARKRASRGVLLLLLVLIASVGLILYMNFADGSRQDQSAGEGHLEVRERDYFFTPAYVMFGLCIGIGAATIVYYVYESVKGSPTIIKKGAIGLTSVLFLLPALSFAKNYHYADRTDNYLAFDYGWNLLQSADENAIFFTNGDNDTFPLWCLQEAYGIRKDVKIVNLSLANTNWYIKQLSPTMGLNFSLTDSQIDTLHPFMDQDRNIIRVNNLVVDQLITDNFGARPINFSVTVGSGGRRFSGQSIDSLLSLKGFAWRLNPRRRNFGVDLEEGYEFFMNPEKFMCRSAADPKIYHDDIAERLARNLGNGIMVVADSLRRAKDYERAEKLLMRARALIPRAPDPLQLLSRVFSEAGETEKLQVLVDTSDFSSKEVMLTALAQTYRRKSEDTKAEAALNRALALNPTYRPAFDELMRIYMQSKRFNAMRAGILRWLQYNPQDTEVKEILDKMENVMRDGDTSVGGDK